MDIPYNLYYLLIDKLRSSLKLNYIRNKPFDCNYEYLDITSIHDVDNKAKGIPSDIILQLDFCYLSYGFLWGVRYMYNTVWINHQGRYIVDIPDPLLESSLVLWINLVKAKYLIDN